MAVLERLMSRSATCATIQHDHIGKMSIVVALAPSRSILKKKGTSSMQYILNLLPLLACPVGMGLMMWVMMRRGKEEMPPDAAPKQEDRRLTSPRAMSMSSVPMASQPSSPLK